MIGYSISIFLVIPLAVIIYYYGKALHKNEYKLYLISLLIASINILLIAIDIELPLGLNLLQNGNIAFAFFTVVMFGGAFKKKTLPYKTILQVRRELAITGFIFLLPHAFLRLDLVLNGYNFTGIIAAIIMIPLVITSFTFVRRKMKPLTWKRVHYMAYIVFMMIYIHLGFTLFWISSNINISYKDGSILYHLLFGGYLLLKIYKVVSEKRIKKV